MQYVNDDMDELFRRAAENYPLDTKTADWNKVLATLQNQTEIKTAPENKGNRKDRFLWLLLLLPLGLICNQFYSPGSLNSDGISKKEVAKENSVTSKDNIQQQNSVRNNKSIDNATVNVTNSNNEISNKEKRIGMFADPSSRVQKKSYSLKADQVRKNNESYTAYNSVIVSSHQKNQSSDNDFTSGETVFLRTYVSKILFDKKGVDDFSTSINRSLSPLINSPEEQLKQNIKLERRKRFYAGVMGGIDATTIKFQKIEDAGSTYGILLGYQLNKKWSIETGAYWAGKNYYSDGKYLNTSKIYMPPNSWIDDVSGTCKMIEVPLAIRYNFSVRKKSSWFSTVGTSSYFMKEENYTYNYYYGTAGPVPHNKEYKNASTNLFSNISISGGYNHRLGNFADLRIEPYVKMPLAGMGIGKLPLFSTGLQVGFAKKF